MTGIIALVLRILLAAALYLFLFFAIYTIWRDLRRQVKSTSNFEIPSIKLTGNSNNAMPFQSLNQSEILIGRRSDCDISTEDTAVSSRHASIYYHHKQWWLKDLGSKNGTYLNGEKVTSPTVLLTGDQIRCGNLSWIIEIQSDLDGYQKNQE